MIFADKLITFRKKAGWSQEEFAEQMGVSRQAVSKWEGAQSIPDMNKLLKISEIFGVSLDYLLKDEIGEETSSAASENTVSDSVLRTVSMEEAHDFLAVKQATAPVIAWGVVLCILSVVPVMLLLTAAETGLLSLSENIAGGIGGIILFLLVGAAVCLFIWSGSRTGKYEFLEKEIFETAYGVTGMVKDRKNAYHDRCTKNTIIGVMLCICSLLPVFVGMILDETNEFLIISMCALMFCFIACGVYLLVRSGIIRESYDKLLQEGEYTKKKKAHAPVVSFVSSFYWLTITALYVYIGFSTNNWGRYAALIWSVAAILFIPIYLLTAWLAEKHTK